MATREIKTKLALEGEQKFKSAMKDAANSIKVLNSEQKLAKATFKQTGDAQKYTAQQADILKKKIEEQKKAVKAAEDAIKQLTSNGVQQNDRAMQQWQTRLNDAKTSLTNMETELQNLSSESEQAASSTDQLGSSLEHLDKTASLEALSNAVGRMADGLGRALNRVRELAQGLVTELQGAASWADELLTTATMWEMDPEQLQRMRKTAKLIDTDVDTILTAQQRFMRNVTSDSKEADKAFKSLGIHVEKYKHGVWSFEDMADPFWEAGQALMTFGNANDQNNIAMQLFGKSWRELVPLFKAGREEYEKTMESQSVVSEENVNKLGELDDAIQKLGNEFETLRMTLDSALAPTLTELSDQLTGFLKELNTYLASDEGKQALKDLGDAFHGLFEDLTKLKPEDVFKQLKSGLDSITDALKWIKNNRQTVVTAIEAVIGAWAGLKITGGILTMIKGINALKELAGLDAKKIAEVIAAASGGGGTAASAVSNAGEAASKGAAGAGRGVKEVVGNFVSSLTPAISNVGFGAMFAGLTYEVAKFDDEKYTAHVNEVAAGVDEITSSAEDATGEVAALADQLKILKDIYLEESGADAFKDLDMSLVSKVAPESGLVGKTQEYGSIEGWLNSGEAVGAQAWAMAEELIAVISEHMVQAASEEIKKQANEISFDKFLPDDYSGNVDLSARPHVDIEFVTKAGWVDEEGNPLGGDYATVLTNTFSVGNQDQGFDFEYDENAVINITPILADGTILSPKSLEDYVADLAAESMSSGKSIKEVDAGKSGLLLSYEIVPEGKSLDEAYEEAGAWAEHLHDLQAEWDEIREAAQEAGTQVPEGAAQGIEEGTETATAAADAMNSEVESTAQAAADSLAAAGEATGGALGDGMARGIDSKVGVVSAAAQRLAGAASKVVNQVLQVHSPSRVFEQIGAYVGMGFAEGIESQISTVQMAAQHMAGAAMVQPTGMSAGRIQGMPISMGGGSGMVDVTLMLGPEKLSEVLVPLVNDGIGAQMALERR